MAKQKTTLEEINELIEQITRRLALVRDYSAQGETDSWLARAELTKIQDDLSVLQALLDKGKH